MSLRKFDIDYFEQNPSSAYLFRPCTKSEMDSLSDDYFFSIAEQRAGLNRNAGTFWIIMQGKPRTNFDNFTLRERNNTEHMRWNKRIHTHVHVQAESQKLRDLLWSNEEARKRAWDFILEKKCGIGFEDELSEHLSDLLN